MYPYLSLTGIQRLGSMIWKFPLKFDAAFLRNFTIKSMSCTMDLLYVIVLYSNMEHYRLITVMLKLLFSITRQNNNAML